MSKKVGSPTKISTEPKSPRGDGGGGGGVKPLRMKHLVYPKGNNADPIFRALASRAPFWVESLTDSPTAGGVSGDGVGNLDVWSANFVWKPTWAKMKPPPSDFVRGCRDVKRRQVINHLIAVEPLCAKHTLCNSMLSYYKGIGEDPFSVMPFTILVTLKGTDPSKWTGWSTFVEAFNRYAHQKPTPKNLWLVKPTGLNRGIGIEVHKDIAAIQTFLQAKAAKLTSSMSHQYQQPGANVYILQKYIENPLLIRGRKFDLRIWVLLNDDGDVFMYLPGYVRTSSESFSLDSEYKYIHLTNYCQQKYAPSFGSYEDGNTLNFVDFERYLNENRPAGMDPTVPILETLIMPQIKTMVCDTFRALQGKGGCGGGFAENGFGKAPSRSSSHRFELLGYDFMVDTNFKVWFIEINTNPSISYQNAWHETMVDKMIEQVFNLVVDPIFPGSSSKRADVPPAIISSTLIPTQARQRVPRDGITALDTYEEIANNAANSNNITATTAVTGSDGVVTSDAVSSNQADSDTLTPRKPASEPSSTSTSPSSTTQANITATVTARAPLWDTLSPGWQHIMNVYKHRSKGELPWSTATPTAASTSSQGNGKRSLLATSPFPIGGASETIKKQPSLFVTATSVTTGEGAPNSVPVLAIRQPVIAKPIIVTNSGTAGINYNRDVPKRLSAVESLLRPMTASRLSPSRDGHRSPSTPTHSRPATSMANATSVYGNNNGSLSARHRSQSKGPTPTVKPSLAMTYNGPMVQHRAGISSSSSHVRSRSQPKSKSTRHVGVSGPTTSQSQALSKTMLPLTSPIRSSASREQGLGLSISQSQLLLRSSATNLAVKAVIDGLMPVPPPPGLSSTQSPKARRTSLQPTSSSGQLHK